MVTAPTPATSPQPRISIVVPMRDPDYGDGLLRRAEIFFRALITLARPRGLSCEIVVVEWNPVPDAPRFRDLLSWPKSLGNVTVRFVEVPAAVHEQLPSAGQIPFMNTRARNVGIRRARGSYILVTGADVVPNGALMDVLASGQLSDRAFYRIDRRDLTHDIPAGWPTSCQLALCSCQDVIVHAYYGSIRERWPWHPSARRRSRKRHDEILQEYQKHLNAPTYTGQPNAFGDDRLIIPADGLHRNASGEFFLMHRDRWHELRGYTELSTRGHGDSLMCWTAASGGLEQVILQPPARLFHQPHGRSAAGTWPATDWRPWYERYLECRRSGEALISNGDDWGLRDHALPEWTLRESEHRKVDAA
jgi:hypothetical protein